MIRVTNQRKYRQLFQKKGKRKEQLQEVCQEGELRGVQSFGITIEESSFVCRDYFMKEYHRLELFF